MDSFKAVVGGTAGIRRTITCWQHEQRGTKRGVIQLGRIRPVVKEIARWVPDGIRSQVAEMMNQIVFGGSAGTTSDLKAAVFGRQTATAASRGKPRRVTGGGDSDSDFAVSAKPKRQKKFSDTATAPAPAITTVRFVDGEEITCEDEDWEGNCSLCGKAWTDSRGQMLESIACDKCDQWFHFHCVGIEQAPNGEFICPKCRCV